MKRVFEIEFPDDLGPLWMNQDNLALCLFTDQHIGRSNIDVADVTEEVQLLRGRYNGADQV